MKRHLWEQDDLHCSIVGTCLSLDELRRLSRQLNLNLPPDLSEYRIHGTFVHLARSQGAESKAMDKLLNRKYAGVIGRFAKAHDDASLRALWREALDQGNVPGPYWAVLSNPHASQELRCEVFGEVHMLSHLVGASNRADIQRLRRVEDECAALRERQTLTRRRYRRLVRALQRENLAKRDSIRAMAKDLETLRQNAKALAPDALRAENLALGQSLAMQSGHLAVLGEERDSLARRCQGLERHARLLQDELEAKQSEIAFLTDELDRAARDAPCTACGCERAGTDRCPGPLLCGKRILYVGGRANLVRHYREMVERAGGEFRHHDGGVEESRKMLPNLVRGVDAVVCPLDCVSHDACAKVKALCHSGNKELRLLTGSGLSTLAQCLEELGARPATPRSIS